MRTLRRATRWVRRLVWLGRVGFRTLSGSVEGTESIRIGMDEWVIVLSGFNLFVILHGVMSLRMELFYLSTRYLQVAAEVANSCSTSTPALCKILVALQLLTCSTVNVPKLRKPTFRHPLK
jgi:hypothetical protein